MLHQIAKFGGPSRENGFLLNADPLIADTQCCMSGSEIAASVATPIAAAETRARTGMVSERIIDRALLAVRLILGLVLLGSVVLRGQISETATTTLVLGGVVFALIVAINLATNRFGARAPHLRSFLGVFQIGADVVLALMVMFALEAESTPLAWVALMLPVTTGWNRFAGKGAGGAWLAASISYVALGLNLGTAAATETSNTLYLAYQQLFAVLLIAVPALYLGSHFRQEIEKAHDAYAVAERRADQLHQVTVAARSMGSENESAVYESLLQGAKSIGFAGADVVRLNPTTNLWAIGHSVHGLGHAAPAGFLAEEVAGSRESVVLDQTSGVAACQQLHDLGVGSAAAIRVDDQARIVLRVWSDDAVTDRESLAVCEALVAQAGVSLAAAGVFQEVTKRSEELAYQANHDVLTGLPNRLNVVGRIDSWLEIFDPATETIALLFLDLDGFKAANDRYGHEAGDQVLRIVAERLKSITPKSGVVARLGGDEFVVLVAGPPGAGAPVALGNAVCARVKEPIAVAGGIANIRASVGVAVHEAGTTRDVLIDRADVCMYLAKRKGGDRIEIFDGSQSLVRA